MPANNPSLSLIKSRVTFLKHRINSNVAQPRPKPKPLSASTVGGTTQFQSATSAMAAYTINDPSINDSDQYVAVLWACVADLTNAVDEILDILSNMPTPPGN